MVRDQPEVYTSAILERAPSDYCAWIQRDSSWGGVSCVRRRALWCAHPLRPGAIELGMLAQRFAVLVRAIDVQTGQVLTFGDEADQRCVYLLFSGVHYDAIVAAGPGGALSEDVTVFDARDAGVRRPAVAGSLRALRRTSTLSSQALAGASRLASEQRRKRQFTDVKRCVRERGLLRSAHA